MPSEERLELIIFIQGERLALRREGDWNTTTPIYVGLASQVAAALRFCLHEWMPVDFIEAPEDLPEVSTLVHERCALCSIAYRARFR